ncbi:phosphate starvation-inducible ATPase phoH [Vibrio ishigakensis]|uniref:Phosphate starvation-inducible ATPase phoH n=1 Tax=Vibrio ishigakensis TaxID=1481914 RepID=A0A0B8NTY9_9VIBR|nr:phosphate starvation-inducible ATPase phoH [Vibrio ishigakensis]
MDDISFNFFLADDVVRHPVVARIVNAYEKWEVKDQKEKKAIEKRRREEREERESKLVAEAAVQMQSQLVSK